jgi:DNA-binding SARP family transcriptional activator/tetratricopeptide (TPR) repeat protein
MGNELEFRLLGPLEVRRDGTPVPLTAAKTRVLLAALLVDTNRTVPVSTLVERLWGADVPAEPRNTLQKQVARLRQALGPSAITTRPDGYLIEVPDDALDTLRFEALTRSARSAPPERASALLAQALDLWRGDPLADVPSEALHQEFVPVWTERRLAALEQRVEADLLLGRHDDLTTELSELTTRHPLRERFWAQRMLALYRSGRQAEALDSYQHLSRTLADELGTDPSPDLRELHQQILTNTVDSPPPAAPAPARNDLPGDIADFEGRAAELDQLLQDGETRRPRPLAVVISAIDGMAGVGKTTLAVHAAHRLADQYPDGQLFLDLHGHAEGEPTEPGAALDALLRAIGVPGERIPADLDQQSSLWRSELATRRMLLVLDNAVSAAQVRPLLPGNPACLALVTSRRRLTDLDGAHTLSLDVLSPGEAVALFTSVVGVERAAAEPEAVREVLRLCGYLPLAVRIAAARLRSRPAWTVARLVKRLNGHNPLAELEVGDRSVALTFSLSYQHLGRQQQKFFRLLGLHPGPDFDVYAAASLAHIDLAEADRLLEELVDVHLLQQPTPGRYRFHDLLREHARHLASSLLPEDAGRAATARMLDYYLYTSDSAARLIAPGQRQLRLDPTRQPDVSPQLADKDTAQQWQERELPTLVKVLDHAAAEDWNQHVWQLAHTLWHVFYLRGYVRDWLSTHELAAASAERARESAGLAASLLHLGIALFDSGRLAEAASRYQQAGVIYEQLGDIEGLAHVHNNMGTIHNDLGNYLTAADHHRAALRIRQEAGDRWNESNSLNNLGIALFRLGDFESALDCYQKSESIYEEVGDLRGLGMTLSNTGHLLATTGRIDDGLQLLLRALDLTRQHGDRITETEILKSIGLAHYLRNDLNEAHSYFEQALTGSTEISAGFEEARAYEGLAHVHRRTDPDTARRHWELARRAHPRGTRSSITPELGELQFPSSA